MGRDNFMVKLTSTRGGNVHVMCHNICGIEEVTDLESQGKHQVESKYTLVSMIGGSKYMVTEAPIEIENKAKSVGVLHLIK